MADKKDIKLNEKIFRPLSEDQLANVNGGAGLVDGVAPQYSVGQHVRIDDCSEFDDMVILKVLWWTPTDGWDYEINAHMPGVGWMDVGCVSESYIHPA